MAEWIRGLLVVLSGPIASGRSSAAHALAVGFRAKGRRATAIDLDLLYKMIDHGHPMGVFCLNPGAETARQ